MCFDADSQPPIAPLAGAAVDGERITLHAADGAHLAAFAARPSAPTGAAVLILPDVRGLYTFYEELALRFAEAGVEALTIDYFGRTADTDKRGEDFDFMPHVDQTRYPNLLLDISAGRDELAARAGVRAVFSVGFCFGGRLSFLSATRPELQLAGAIGFYGGVVGPSRGGIPAPAELADEVSCPILGLFGGADSSIPPESIDTYRQLLTAKGIDNQLIAYDGAPHSFFDRKAAEFSDASTDAWRRVLEFVGDHTLPK